MALRAAEFLQAMLEDFESYVRLFFHRPMEARKGLEASIAYFDDLERRRRDLMKRVPVATRLIQAAGYDASRLLIIADKTMSPGTMNLLLVAIGAYENGLEQERTTLIARTKAGIERACRQGTTLGRPKASQVLLHVARGLVASGTPISEAARLKGVSRSTLQRFLNVG